MNKSDKGKKSRQGISFNLKNFFPHVVAMLSLLPILIALWFAIPDISFQVGDRTVEITGVLSQFNNDFTRFGFKEGYELQNGVSLNYNFTYEENSLDIDTATGSTTTSSGTNGTGEISIDLNEAPENQLTETESDLDKTVRLFRERVLKSGIASSRIQLVNLNDNNYEFIVELSGTREKIGQAIPILLPMTGEISLWYDDPGYSATGSNTISAESQFLEGKKPLILEDEDILNANYVNDVSTGGRGFKVQFSEAAIIKLIEAANEAASVDQTNNPNASGFIFTIDGYPVGIQSPYQTSPDSISFYALNSDESVIKLLTEVINQDQLPIEVSFANSNNNILNTPTQVEIETYKLALAIGFGIFLLGLVYIYRNFSYPLIILNVGALIIAIAFHKTFQSYFTIELLLGSILALMVHTSIFAIFYEKLIKSYEKRNLKEIKETIRTMKRTFTGFFFIPVIPLLFLVSLVATQSISIMITGFGVVILADVILIWTAFATFLREIFILPLQNAKK